MSSQKAVVDCHEGQANEMSKFWCKNQMSAHCDVYLTFSNSWLIFNSSQVKWGRDLKDGALEVRGSSRSDR